MEPDKTFQEKTIHQCSPSQIVNLKHFILSGLLAVGIIAIAIILHNPLVLVLLVVPFVYAWWKWKVVKSTKFTLTDQRIIFSKGIFNKVTNETELYRVRDTSIEEPFYFRMFGVGNIVVFSTDE